MVMSGYSHVLVVKKSLPDGTRDTTDDQGPSSTKPVDDECDEYEYTDSTPNTGDTADEQCRGTSVTESVVDGGTKVVVDYRYTQHVD
jgi:hypothetical protein